MTDDLEPMVNLPSVYEWRDAIEPHADARLTSALWRRDTVTRRMNQHLAEFIEVRPLDGAVLYEPTDEEIAVPTERIASPIAERVTPVTRRVPEWEAPRTGEMPL